MPCLFARKIGLALVVIFISKVRKYSNLDRTAGGHLVFWLLTCFRQTVYEVVIECMMFWSVTMVMVFPI